MYRELRQKEADLVNQVRVAALSETVTDDRLALHFPELMQGATPPVSKVLTPDEELAVADPGDDFEGETVFTMDPEEAIAILASMGQRVTLDDMGDSDGPS